MRRTAVTLTRKVLFLALIFLSVLALLILSLTTPWTIRCPRSQPPTLPHHVPHARGECWMALIWLYPLMTPKTWLLHIPVCLPMPCSTPAAPLQQPRRLQDSAQIPPAPGKPILQNQPPVISYLLTVYNRLSVSHTPSP